MILKIRVHGIIMTDKTLEERVTDLENNQRGVLTAIGQLSNKIDQLSSKVDTVVDSMKGLHTEFYEMKHELRQMSLSIGGVEDRTFNVEKRLQGVKEFIFSRQSNS